MSSEEVQIRQHCKDLGLETEDLLDDQGRRLLQIVLPYAGPEARGPPPPPPPPQGTFLAPAPSAPPPLVTKAPPAQAPAAAVPPPPPLPAAEAQAPPPPPPLAAAVAQAPPRKAAPLTAPCDPAALPPPGPPAGPPPRDRSTGPPPPALRHKSPPLAFKRPEAQATAQAAQSSSASVRAAARAPSRGTKISARARSVSPSLTDTSWSFVEAVGAAPAPIAKSGSEGWLAGKDPIVGAVPGATAPLTAPPAAPPAAQAQAQAAGSPPAASAGSPPAASAGPWTSLSAAPAPTPQASPASDSSWSDPCWGGYRGLEAARKAQAAARAKSQLRRRQQQPTYHVPPAAQLGATAGGVVGPGGGLTHVVDGTTYPLGVVDGRTVRTAAYSTAPQGPAVPLPTVRPWTAPQAQAPPPLLAPPPRGGAPHSVWHFEGDSEGPELPPTLRGLIGRLQPLGGLTGKERAVRALELGSQDVTQVAVAQAGNRVQQRADDLPSAKPNYFVILRDRDGVGPWVTKLRSVYGRLAFDGKHYHWGVVSRAFQSLAEAECYCTGAGLAFPNLTEQ